LVALGPHVGLTLEHIFRERGDRGAAVTEAIIGAGHYTKLGKFLNLWVVTFNSAGRCSVFRMWNNEI
jgi:hypothetical protein